jgi:hypothetical protein
MVRRPVTTHERLLANDGAVIRALHVLYMAEERSVKSAAREVVASPTALIKAWEALGLPYPRKPKRFVTKTSLEVRQQNGRAARSVQFGREKIRLIMREILDQYAPCQHTRRKEACPYAHRHYDRETDP